MTLAARVARLEKGFDASDEYEYDLEQLLELSQGVAAAEVGPPRRIVKPGAPTLTALICMAIPRERGDRS